MLKFHRKLDTLNYSFATLESIFVRDGNRFLTALVEEGSRNLAENENNAIIISKRTLEQSIRSLQHCRGHRPTPETYKSQTSDDQGTNGMPVTSRSKALSHAKYPASARPMEPHVLSSASMFFSFLIVEERP